MKPVFTKKRWLLWLYAALLCGVVGCMVAISRCTPDGRRVDNDAEHSQDTMRVAIMYAPMSYYVYDDTLGGLNYDLLRKFAKETKRPVKFTPIVDLNEALKRLRNGDFDLLASLPVNYSMSKEYAFSEPLYLDRQVLVQLKGKNGKPAATSVLDLGNDTVDITSDSPVKFRLSHVSEEIGEPLTIRQHNDLSEEYLVMKVANGDIKYAVVNEKTAEKVKEALGDDRLEFSTPVSFTQFQSWVFPHTDSALLQEVNDWIVKEKVFQQSLRPDSIP